MVVNRDVKTGCQTLVAGRACEASFYAKAVLEWIKSNTKAKEIF